MLKKNIEEALNAQINAEMWSAYLYLSMAAHCHAIGQPGMGKWFEVQFKEEQDHAKILFNYVIARNGKEEENVQTIIDNIKMVQDNGYGLYMIDKELGSRTYSEASPLTK